MKTLLWLFFVSTMAAPAAAQFAALPGGCATGQCPIAAGPGNFGGQAAPATLQVDSKAIVRIDNVRGASRAAGTGTLVDDDAQNGLVITCAHLFREGVGAVTVTFPSGQAFGARVIKIDSTADLAALSIKSPSVAPVKIAEQYPQRGDALVSCGYGSDGRLWCNRGQLLGYVTASGGQGFETLELSGAARFGDSGGPVFDRNHQLVAVLFGTNGRVVDGTYCGRIRRFLSGLSPRFGSRPPAAAAPAAPLPGAVEVSPPLAPVQPDSQAAPIAEQNKLAKLEQLIARLTQGWQALGAKVEAIASAAQAARQAEDGQSPGAPMPPPPHIELPPGLGSIAKSADPIASVAEPWLSAKLAAVLISFGIPGGAAGVAAGAAVWLLMRRAKNRLQNELDRIKGTGAEGSPSDSSGANADSSTSTIERHHNRYVPYQISALDKAWAAAHAHVGEKYPGAVPYLKIAESVKDQLLAGNNDSPSS